MLKSPENENYSVSLIMLSTPLENNKVEILLKQPNGDSIYAGIANGLNDNVLNFHIRAVKHPGIAPILFTGIFSDNKFSRLEGLSNTGVVDRKAPGKMKLGLS